MRFLKCMMILFLVCFVQINFAQAADQETLSKLFSIKGQATPAEQTAPDVNLASLVGNYKFAHASSDGALNIVQQGNDFVISVGTYHSGSGHTCSFEGNCSTIDGKIICKGIDGEEGMDVEIKIVDGNTLELSAECETERFFCGMNGFFSGKYKK